MLELSISVNIILAIVIVISPSAAPRKEMRKELGRSPFFGHHHLSQPPLPNASSTITYIFAATTASQIAAPTAIVSLLLL
jgi:hypothetical protein